MLTDRNSSFAVIGDIHGCAKTLEALLEKLADEAHRTFVFIGDYIDRGPDSKSVVDLIIKFAADHDCVFLRGNHEQMMLDALETNDAARWLRYGGRDTLKSYNQTFVNLNFSSQHHHFYQNSKIFYETESYFFVHGGIPPQVTIAEAVADEDIVDMMMWTRDHIEAKQTAWEKKVIFGHTPTDKPFHTNDMIGIDTGCVYRNLPGLGKLTALLLPEEEFIYMDCIDNPEPY